METQEDLELVVAATTRLLETVSNLSEEAVRESSILPGWSRGHVLTHLSRNSDGLRNLFLSARSGESVSMYGSVANRDADIESGATRPTETILIDTRETARRFILDARSLPEDAWSIPVRWARGNEDGPYLELGTVLWLRASELEFHHVDLGAGYSFVDTPPALLDRLIAHALRRLEAQGAEPLVCEDEELETSWSCGIADDPPKVSGSSHAILGWLSGRFEAEGLRVAGNKQLPRLPSLG